MAIVRNTCRVECPGRGWGGIAHNGQKSFAELSYHHCNRGQEYPQSKQVINLFPCDLDIVQGSWARALSIFMNDRCRGDRAQAGWC